MNTCAFLLLLAVQIYAEGIEGPTGKEPISSCFQVTAHLGSDASSVESFKSMY